MTMRHDTHKARARALLAAGAGLLALAGCTGPNDERHITDYPSTHPVTVDPQVVSLAVPAGGQAELPADHRARLMAFAEEYKARGHGPLTIAAPKDAVNSPRARAKAERIAAALDAVGITGAAVQRVEYMAAPGTDAPVMLSFQRYVATASDCHAVWDDHKSRTRNRPSSNFGCSQAKNLAAMVADPADIARPRGLGHPSADRQNRIFDAYRDGKTTASQVEREASDSKSNASDL